MEIRRINPHSAVGKCLNIYKEFDTQAIKYKTTCKKRCCICCYDYFYISEAEFYTILYDIIHKNKGNEYLDTLILKAIELSNQLKYLIPKEYEKIHSNILSKPISYYINPIDIGLIRLGKPCIFLNSKNKCEIYNVRPLVCRQFGTVIRSDMKCFVCENVHYHHNIDYSKTNNSQKVNSLLFAGKYFRMPKPLLYWFSEFIPIIKLNNYCVLKKMCEQDYEEYIRRQTE